MQRLHLVGFTADHDGLIFSTRRGAKSGGFVATLDDDLLALVREAVRLQSGVDIDFELERAEARAEMARERRRSGRVHSELSPREIQARLRAGRSVADVADEAGVDEDWVLRFAAPVLAEQAQILAQALAIASHANRKGESAESLADSVALNMIDRGMPMTEDELAAGWSAYHLRDGSWVIRFRYISRRREQLAQWAFDLSDRELVPLNRLASELGYVEPGRKKRKASLLQAVHSDERRANASAPEPARELPRQSAPSSIGRDSGRRVSGGSATMSPYRRMAGASTSMTSSRRTPAAGAPAKAAKKSTRAAKKARTAAKKRAAKAAPTARRAAPTKAKAASSKKATATKGSASAKRVGTSGAARVSKVTRTAKKSPVAPTKRGGRARPAKKAATRTTKVSRPTKATRPAKAAARATNATRTPIAARGTGTSRASTTTRPATARRATGRAAAKRTVAAVAPSPASSPSSRRRPPVSSRPVPVSRRRSRPVVPPPAITRPTSEPAPPPNGPVPIARRPRPLVASRRPGARLEDRVVRTPAGPVAAPVGPPVEEAPAPSDGPLASGLFIQADRAGQPTTQ